MIAYNYNIYSYGHRYSWPKSIQVVYDKGRDNDATLRSKLVSAFRKTGTNMYMLNTKLHELKRHKSVLVFY